MTPSPMKPLQFVYWASPVCTVCCAYSEIPERLENPEVLFFTSHYVNPNIVCYLPALATSESNFPFSAFSICVTPIVQGIKACIGNVSSPLENLSLTIQPFKWNRKRALGHWKIRQHSKHTFHSAGVSVRVFFVSGNHDYAEYKDAGLIGVWGCIQYVEVI